MRPILVLKLGGASVFDPNALRQLLLYLESDASIIPLLVVSAGAGVTDQLLAIFQFFRSHNHARIRAGLESLDRRHRLAAAELLDDDELDEYLRFFAASMAELEQLLSESQQKVKASLRLRDAVLAFGEEWAARLVYAYLCRTFEDVERVDACQVIMTDQNFGQALPLHAETKLKVETVLMPRLFESRVTVIQGFVGTCREGYKTTLGRGGSDFTATYLASLLPAQEIRIWSDVQGIKTCDPKVVPEAVLIPRLAYGQAETLAYYGVKVLHPKCIEPIKRLRIPLHVQSALHPNLPCTSVLDSVRSPLPGYVITGRPGLHLVRLRRREQMNPTLFQARVFKIAANYFQCIDAVTCDHRQMTFAISERFDFQAFFKEVEDIARYQVACGLAAVCVLGCDFGTQNEIQTLVGEILQRAAIAPQLVVYDEDELRLVLAIPEHQLEAALKTLHRELNRAISPVVIVREEALV